MAELDEVQNGASRERLDERTLPIAIGNLFKMNNYDVEYDVQVHGAQIDVVAKAKADPFANPVYIEATVEYVANDKYGKDTTKFILLARKMPGATLLCISSKGFTAAVKERALESGITTLTYDDLFGRFEKFSPYVTKTLNDPDAKKLTTTYEEPLFNDGRGTDVATVWLKRWKSFSPDNSKWLIVLGEYGTGKTSLTKVLQHRWLQDYRDNPSSPIPVRIELRNFSRQFDAKGLLHHFLDHNDLGHVPIEFMMHLITTGRVILLLDGYDEMAQFLNARERRSCLSALAELAADGAKGILTSRPNYFTETEELNVFEALYKVLDQNRLFISRTDATFVADEKSVDELVERYVLNRYERSLQDLTPGQTESLVKRSLQRDQAGQALVLSILKKVFREEAEGRKQALSGKPVIIAYLLELVDEIRKEKGNLDLASLTEWQVYTLIVDRLMFRDLRRSTLNPMDRRRTLQKLALRISTRDVVFATEELFQTIIDEDFQSELRRMPADERRIRRIELFEDLRSSATLTRASGTKSDGWVFSHNSLREYLAVERLLDSLRSKAPLAITIPITPAMRGFVASMSVEALEELWTTLCELWPQRASTYALGPYLCLLWEAGKRIGHSFDATLASLSGAAAGDPIQISGITLKDIHFSTEAESRVLSLNAANTSMSDVDFTAMDARGSSFKSAILDSVSFRDADLSGCSFNQALLFECDLSGCLVEGADFSGLEKDSNFVVISSTGDTISLSGNHAIGYLRYHGAITDEVDQYAVWRNHPKFAILQKICEKVSLHKNSQLRGLTQRGESQIDPPFARRLVDRMVSDGWLVVDKNELVSVTSSGRDVIGKVVRGDALAPSLGEFMASNS